MQRERILIVDDEANARTAPRRIRGAGIVIDEAANSGGADGLRRISADASDVEVFVAPVDEAMVTREEAAKR